MSLIDELEYYETVDLPIFLKEFADWLPNRIFDVHTHAWLPEHLLKPISEERVGLVFEADSVSWQDLESAYELLFPGIQVEWLALPMPLSVIDREANNSYVASQSDHERTFGLYVPGLDEDEDTLLSIIRSGSYVGFKPYLSYVTWKEIEEIRVTDFVTPAQLEVANQYGLIIMLHVPRSGRLADQNNLEDLKKIGEQYPDAAIILAHAGRAYSRDIIEPGLGVLADFPNIFFDLSNVQDKDVISAMLESLPIGRIMYGTDIPVATVRGFMFMLNGQRVCITRKKFPWSISSDIPGQLRCTFMGYEGLRAIKHAAQECGIDQDGVAAIFYKNAHNLVNTIWDSVANIS